MIKKTIKTQKSLIFLLAIGLMLAGSTPSYSQLGKLKNKLKNKARSALNSNNSSSSSSTSSNSSSQNAELNDQGITSDLHQKYIGKIVWASEKIDFKNLDETKFKSSFTTDDFIYGRFFLPKSMQRTILEETNKKYDNIVYFYDVYVDGEKKEWTIESEQAYNEYLERTTQQVWVYIPKDSDRVGWMKLVNSLSTGEHEFKIDLRARKNSNVFESVFATGSFKLTKKEGANIKIGLSYSTIEAGMKDAEIEKNIHTCISKYAKNSGWKETFNNVKIKSTDWYIVRNKYSGVILGRSLTAYCFATWPDGHCTVQQFSFKQQYDGSSYGKAFRFNGVISGTQKETDCE